MGKKGYMRIESALLLGFGAIIVTGTAIVLFLLTISQDGQDRNFLQDIVGSVQGNQPIPTEEAFDIQSTSPGGILPQETKQVTLIVETTQNALCRYSLVPNQEFGEMPLKFENSGEKTHTTRVLTLLENHTYTYYIKCASEEGEITQDDQVISFQLTGGADTTPPVRFNGTPTGTLGSGVQQAQLTLNTDEPSVCKYSTQAGTPYGAMSASFQTTGGTSHRATITGLAAGQSRSYFVRCRDQAGNVNSDDFPISFQTAGTVSSTGPDLFNPKVNGIPSKATLPLGTTVLTFSVQSDVPSSCRYSRTPGKSFASMTDALSGNGSTSHSGTLSGFGDGEFGALFVRCMDEDGQTNNVDFPVDYAISQEIRLALDSGNDDRFITSNFQIGQGLTSVLIVSARQFEGLSEDEIKKITYIRWRLPFLANATISSAHLEMTAASDSSGGLSTTITLLDPSPGEAWQGNNGFNETAYPGQALLSIPLSGTTTAWNMPTWGTGVTYSSPNIAGLVQEQVNQGFYQPNSYLGIRIEGGSPGGEDPFATEHAAHAYEGNPSNAPVLVVVYAN